MANQPIQLPPILSNGDAWERMKRGGYSPRFAEAIARYLVATAEMEADANEAAVREHGDAIDALLLLPANSHAELREKLVVFSLEEIVDHWHCAPEIAAMLAVDACRLLGVAR